MPQLTEKKLILAIAAGGLLVAGGSFGGVYWVDGMIQEEQTLIQDIKTKIAAAEAKKAKIPQHERQVIILRENVSEYAKILPQKKQLTDFVRTIQSFGQNSGVAIRSLKPVNTDKGGAFMNFSYQISLRGTVWQFMRFMNSFESYDRFVRVQAFTLTAGKPELDQEMVEHDVAMTVQTFVYNPGSGGPPVKIQNYNRKRDYLREEIHGARANIALDNYAFKGDRSRRDIFVDPRYVNTGGTEEPGQRSLPPPQQLRIVQEMAEEIASLKAQFEEAMETKIILVRIEMLEALKKQMIDTRLKIDKIEDLDQIRFRPYRTKFAREVTEPFAALESALNRPDETGPTPGIPMKELVGFQEEIERYLEDGRLQDAKSRFQVYQGKLDFKPSDERYEVARILKDLQQKTVTALEFTQVTLKISGVILQKNGLSAAIINGKTYQEGDAIGDQLFLKSIGPELIEFLYKGVVIAQRR
jgi:Tfp pilus assembly protein PilO